MFSWRWPLKKACYLNTVRAEMLGWPSVKVQFKTSVGFGDVEKKVSIWTRHPWPGLKNAIGFEKALWQNRKSSCLLLLFFFSWLDLRGLRVPYRIPHWRNFLYIKWQQPNPAVCILRTFRFFIKSPEEGRLVRSKYREIWSRFSLCCFVVNVYIFVTDPVFPDQTFPPLVPKSRWFLLAYPDFKSVPQRLRNGSLANVQPHSPPEEGNAAALKIGTWQGQVNWCGWPLFQVN